MPTEDQLRNQLKREGFFAQTSTRATDVECVLWNSFGAGTNQQYVPSGRGVTTLEAINAAIKDRETHKDRIGGYKP